MMEAETAPRETVHKPRRLFARVGLSGKLLLFTFLFVTLAGVLIYVPSVSNYRLMWLSDRLRVKPPRSCSALRPTARSRRNSRGNC
jgi:hypothetical protein